MYGGFAMIELQLLRDAEAASPFRHMTFPAYRGLLDFDPGDVHVLAIGMFEGGAPAGLALASARLAVGEAKLLSIFVEERVRGHGLGTTLVRRIETECAELQIAKLSGTYMSGQPATSAVERILARAGWSAPQLRMLVVRCSATSLKSMPWFRRLAMPPGYDIVPWVELRESEREELRESHRQERWIAEELYPFDYERGIEPVTSLALRVHGKVLGWCLNHLLDGLLRCTCSYLRKDLQQRARGLVLWSEMIDRMSIIGVEICMWTVPAARDAMVRFNRTHVQPYALFFGETLGVERLIEPIPQISGSRSRTR